MPRSTSINDEATEYARAVRQGKTVAGPHVRNACQRHLDDIKGGAARGLVWDVEASQRHIGFCRDMLKLSEGQFEGLPFSPEPVQCFIQGSLFGWKGKDGQRRFRRAYIEMGKGNGKSPMAGAIGLYGLVADGEAGAQVYSAGATKDQANILFRDAVKMVDQSPALDNILRRSGGPGNEYNLAHLSSGSFFRPVSRETRKTGSGPRPHMALCDEIHEHPDGGVIEILERGFKFRKQPLLLMITNSGSDRQSVCFEERKHAVSVAAGDIEDDSTFSYVCALDEGEDPLDDPACWIKANPLLGVTIQDEYLAGVARQAKALPSKRNNILRLHFCVWTESNTAWIEREAWAACIDEDMRLRHFAGQEVTVSYDLSMSRDMTARALIFDDGKTEDGEAKFAVFVRGYLPRTSFENLLEKDGFHWGEFEKTDHLYVIDGKVIKLDYVAEELVELSQDYEVREVVYDRYLFPRFEQKFDDMGADFKLVEHGQGFSKGPEGRLWMPESIDMLERLILEGRIRIESNGALGYSAFSAITEESPAGLRRFSKSKVGKSKIDMLVALTMAVGAATREDDKISDWDGDILFI